ncbi:MAG: sodium:solute symporter [Rhodothermaceae bacterium]|nr:sodium:solute symporter [Rhodothermaceae bacterium]
MNVVFTFLDWFWVVMFLLLMIGSGILFYRLGKRSESDFFLAGRGLPWWLPASSVYATHTATDTPMWITGVSYKHGMAGIWYTFFSAWAAISAFVSTRIFRRSLAYTQAEWNVVRFTGIGAEMLRGWMAGWQVFMNMFILGWVGIAMGKVCEFLFGWEPWIGLITFSAVCAIYVLAAGYWGVVMADFQQGIIAFLIIMIVSIWGIVEAGGPSGIVEKLQNLDIQREARIETLAAMDANQLSSVSKQELAFFGADTTMTYQQIATLEATDFSMPRTEASRTNPFAFTGWATGDLPLAWCLTMIFIAILGGFGMGTTIDWYAEAQRIQSAKTVRDATYSIWWGTLVGLVRNSIWAVAILAFYVLNPWVFDVGEYEMGWFRLGFDYLPAGMLGFFFAAILAIHLSTISSHLNLGALYATRDLFHHYAKPDASEKELVWVGRISTLILLVGSFFFGLMMEDITSWLIFAIWIMAAGIWLPNILQVIWWRFNSWGYLSAWMANLAFSWLIVWILPHYGVLPELADYQQFWLLMIFGAFVYIPVTFLTKPEDMDHLVKYYVQARPVGFWGPVRKEAIRRGLINDPNAAATT